MRKRAASSRRWVIGALVLIIAGALGQLAWTGWNSWRYRRAEDALARRDFAEARQLLSAIGHWKSANGETLLLATQAVRRDGDLDAAADLLAAAQRANAVPEAIEFERDLLRLQSGRTEDAERFIEICQAHPSAAPSPLILEALIVGSLRRLDLTLAQRCLDLWQQSHERPPDQIQSWIWQGEIAIRQGDLDAAVREFRRAVEADPQHHVARLRLAELLSRYEPREALVHLEWLQKTRPRDRDVLFQRARCHRALGELEPAEQWLAQILDVSPADVGAILERGHIALELRQFENAERWFRDAVRIQPEQREPNLALARCLQLRGNEQESQRYRAKVAKIDATLDERMRRLKEKGRLEE